LDSTLAQRSVTTSSCVRADLHPIDTGETTMVSFKALAALVLLSAAAATARTRGRTDAFRQRGEACLIRSSRPATYGGISDAEDVQLPAALPNVCDQAGGQPSAKQRTA
jgi:hypothetical protein